jgi:hypothetical protein
VQEDVLSIRNSDATSPMTQLAREIAVRTARSGDAYRKYGFVEAVLISKKRLACQSPVPRASNIVPNKSKHPEDDKCQASDCDNPCYKRGPVSGLFLCEVCRRYEINHKFSINSAERATYLHEKEHGKPQAPKPNGGVCEGNHCEAEHTQRGAVSKLHLCNSCKTYQFRQQLGINSAEGIAWQLQRNEKRRKTGH